MPTYNQLYKNKRVKKKKQNKTPALEKCSQKKGICTKLVLRTPKKPNSASQIAFWQPSNSKFASKGDITPRFLFIKFLISKNQCS